MKKCKGEARDMALISAICLECHASIKLDDSKPFGFCMSCGSKITIAALYNPQEKKTDNSESIKNYLSLARNAKQAKNNEQCEMYCNKILEIDAESAEAWALKGSAAGWQSSLRNLRTDEMLICYGKADKFARTEEEKKAIHDLACADMKSIAAAIIQLQCDRFAKWPDEDEANALNDQMKHIFECGIKYIQNMGSSEYKGVQVVEELVPLIIDTVKKTEEKIKYDFIHANQGYPRDYDWQTMMEKMRACNMAYNYASVGVHHDHMLKIRCYEALIENLKWSMDKCSYQSEYSAYYERFVHVRSLGLSAEARESRQKIIENYENEIAKAKQEEAAKNEEIRKERIANYWAAHLREKEKLLEEKKRLENEIKPLSKKLEAIDSSPEVVNITREKEKLAIERKTLSIFRMKDRKAIDAKIADFQSRLDIIFRAKKDPVQQQIDKRNSRIQEIEDELNRDR